MWISRKRWRELEQRVSHLERIVNAINGPRKDPEFTDSVSKGVVEAINRATASTGKSPLNI